MALGFKNEMTNLVDFNACSDKSENLHFNVLLFSIAFKVSAKKVQKSYLITLKNGQNLEEKLTFCFKNDMR